MVIDPATPSADTTMIFAGAEGIPPFTPFNYDTDPLPKVESYDVSIESAFLGGDLVSSFTEPTSFDAEPVVLHDTDLNFLGTPPTTLGEMPAATVTASHAFTPSTLSTSLIHAAPLVVAPLPSFMPLFTVSYVDPTSLILSAPLSTGLRFEPTLLRSASLFGSSSTLFTVATFVPRTTFGFASHVTGPLSDGISSPSYSEVDTMSPLLDAAQAQTASDQSGIQLGTYMFASEPDTGGTRQEERRHRQTSNLHVAHMEGTIPGTTRVLCPYPFYTVDENGMPYPFHASYDFGSQLGSTTESFTFNSAPEARPMEGWNEVYVSISAAISDS